MKTSVIFLIPLLLTIPSISIAARPEPELIGPTQTKPQPIKDDNNDGVPDIPGGVFPPGTGFNIPGMSPGWAGGYGSGSSGPNGGHSKSGVIRPSVVCKDKGPCYKKKLTCPAKCFTSYSHSGKNYGSGGGGGGCTIDCKKCVAYC